MKTLSPFIAILFLIGLSHSSEADDGLLLEYRLDEGSGTAIHDSSGAGRDGTLKGGAAWVTEPYGAISLDGKDGFIEGPSGLDIGAAGTLELWCYPRVFGGGLISWHYEHPATPKPLSLYFDIYSYNRLLGVASDWKNDPIAGPDPYVQWNAALTNVVEGTDRTVDLLNRWSHIALTFDAHELRLYRNGKLQASKPSFFLPDTRHVPLRIGMGYAQGLPYFNGMVANIRVYTRALDANEIEKRFADSAPTFHPELPYSLSFVPRLEATQQNLRIEADVSGLPDDAASIEMKLISDEGVLREDTQKIGKGNPVTILNFPTKDLPAGAYKITAAVRDAQGALVHTAARGWQLPKLAAPGVVARNNLTADLLDRTDLKPAEKLELRFTNPREGFVFIQCDVVLGRNDALRIDLQSPPDLLVLADAESETPPLEAMRYLPEGELVLKIQCQGAPKLQRFIVRSIPELMFCGYPTGAGKVEGYGAYDFDFLRKDVLPNINGIVGIGGSQMLQQQRWTDEVRAKWNTFEEWKCAGRRWYQEIGIPSAASTYRWKDDPLTAEQATDWIRNSIGFTDADLSGIVADEFGLGADAPTDTHPHRDPRYRTAPYTEAVRRIGAMLEYREKKMYMWCGGLDRSESRSQEFVNAVIAAGGKLATEEYLAERATAEEGLEVLRGDLRTKIDRASETFPGIVEKLILVPSIMSAPPETENVDPHVDYKVWMDMQMQYMATAPELFGLGGIMWYKISYADEEAVRWMGRLFRHYVLDGETTPLAETYHYAYRPEIISNADFDDGLNGWTVHEAETGSVTAGTYNRLGYHQGRRMLHSGNHFLLTKRSSSGPNKVTQTIKNLRAGELYSVKMLACDYQALLQDMNWTRSDLATNARVTVDGADMLPEKSFVSNVGGERGPQIFAYHRLVFRAKAETATIAISDWPRDDSPADATIGQQLAINFVEVLPYFV
ncbi:MAG: LamG domain-containing protein [Candidatus Hydrogenedentes bacterium]|nr:LamG domain-containing protein [Candidatus Hydrogenedentota bacterium]